MTRHLPAECTTCGTEFRSPVDEDGAADAVCGGCAEPCERCEVTGVAKLYDSRCSACLCEECLDLLGEYDERLCGRCAREADRDSRAEAANAAIKRAKEAA